MRWHRATVFHWIASIVATTLIAWAAISLLLILLMLPGCATHQHVVELGAGYDRHIDEGSNPQSVIRYRYEPRDGSGWLLEFDHHSSIPDGRPFNRNPEDLVNQWSVIYRFVF